MKVPDKVPWQFVILIKVYGVLLGFWILLMWLMVSLSGCAALPGIFDAITGDMRQKPTRTPLYIYRADLLFCFEGEEKCKQDRNAEYYDGVATSYFQDQVDIVVNSQIDLDRVEIESCSRHQTCQNGKPCSEAFDVETGFWGAPGQRMTYHYWPTDMEKKKCPLFIKAFSKQGLAAWGFIAFRNDEENLPAKLLCNGERKNPAGHSSCQTKAGKFQRISFAEPIEDYEADESCQLTKIDDKQFQLRPDIGLCTAVFYAKEKWHMLDMIAYDEVLVRGK